MRLEVTLSNRLFSALPLNQVVDFHDEAVEGDLLGAQLLLHSGHCLDQQVVLLVLGVILSLFIVAVQLDKLLLELLLCVRFVLLTAVDLHDVSELGSLFALPNLNNDAHDDILEQISSINLVLVICFLLIAWIFAQVVDWIDLLGL